MPPHSERVEAIADILRDHFCAIGMHDAEEV